MPSEVDAYLSQNSSLFEEQLCELLRIPSVSADSRHKGDIAQAAQWVAAQFRDLGMSPEICETAGHPIVYAEHS